MPRRPGRCLLEALIALVIGIVIVVIAVLIGLFLMALMFYAFIGIFPLVGIIIVCIAVIAGMKVAISSLFLALRQTYGHEGTNE